MRITRLEAKSIGPFSDLAIDFKEKQIKDKAEIHILTGENGTGKSTILEMLVASFCYEGGIMNFQSLDNLNLKFSVQKKTLFEVSFDDESIIKFESNDYELQVYRDKFGISPLLPNSKLAEFIFKLRNYRPDIPFDFAAFAYSGYRRLRSENNLSINEIRQNPFENALSFNNSINPSLILQWIANIKTKFALAHTNGDSERKEKYRRTIADVESSISDIISKTVEFVLEDDPLGVKIKLKNDKLDFDTLPDGLKSIISWLSDLLMRLDRINWADKSKSILEQNFILFLDEIEVHLHPAWQRKILPVVQELFPNAQIFISTHSPFVVGSVDGAWVYNFKLDENNNSYLEKEPYLTEDGHSYDRILEETFGIKERFGVGVQAQLEKFKEYKNKILAGENVDNEAFMKLAKEIADQSIELNSTIGFEIRQIERLTKKTLETV